MKNNRPLVLFYTAVPRLFRATYIGYVYEISRKFPVILLSEKLDPESENALRNKKWFPYLEKVIPVDQYTGKKRSLWEAHKEFHDLAKEIIDLYRPDVIIAGSIVNPLEKYLFRFGKLSGATNIAFQAGFQATSPKEYDERYYLLFRDTPKNVKLPLWVREVKLVLAKIKIHFDEVVDFWLYPLLLGTYPFFSKSLFRIGHNSWVREFDCQTAFSHHEADIEIKTGRNPSQVKILPHPLTRNTREIFEKAYTHFKKKNVSKKAITILIDVNTYGHRRDNLTLIPESHYMKSRVQVISMIAAELPGYKIYLKPHPTTKLKNFKTLKKYFSEKFPNVTITDPMDPVDQYITQSEIIVGFPTPSTTLMTAMFQDPAKIIIYVDVLHEILGDEFKIYPGIFTIDSAHKLKKLLAKLKSKRLNRMSYDIDKGEFEDAASLIADVLNERIRVKH